MPITTTKSLRDLGKDEYWLQDAIYANPSILGLGDLEPVSKEKTQATGGRLDILLKDPETDAMFEVEVMLGETDETHIVRTIEYWDVEKRRWPKREHTAVLVAERINSRFYNVVHLLSLNIPIIGIQVNAVEVEGRNALHFAKIIDSYEEPEVERSGPQDQVDESYWLKESSESVAFGKKLQAFFASRFQDVVLRYAQNYITLTICGIDRLWIRGRKNGASLLEVRVDQTKEPAIRSALDGRVTGYKLSEGYATWTTSNAAFKPDDPVYDFIAGALYPKDLRKKEG